MHLGENIKRMRAAKNISQDHLAELSGISKGQISKLELGTQKNPTLETVVTLASNLGLSLDELVFGKINEDDPQSQAQERALILMIEELPEDKKQMLLEIISTVITSETMKKITRKNS